MEPQNEGPCARKLNRIFEQDRNEHFELHSYARQNHFSHFNFSKSESHYSIDEGQTGARFEDPHSADYVGYKLPGRDTV